MSAVEEMKITYMTFVYYKWLSVSRGGLLTGGSVGFEDTILSLFFHDC